MKRIGLLMMLLGVISVSASASTVAYWRFEEGPAGTNVARNGLGDGQYYGAIADSSGNGNELSTWSDGGGAGYVYRDKVAGSTILPTGAANNYSVKNTGGYPAMWTDPTDAISSIAPSAFTIEATFKLENGGYRTIVGRDSRGTATQNGDLSALYFQAMPDNVLAIKFCDAQGYWHEALSAANAFQSFDYPSDNDGDLVPWYSMAAVSDGSLLSLYLKEHGGHDWQMIAQTDMTLSESTDTALTAGAGDGGDWDAGQWTVGRGLYAGGHGDRAWGFIDEVRISDAALAVDEFLVPEPATMILLGLGALALRRRNG